MIQRFTKAFLLFSVAALVYAGQAVGMPFPGAMTDETDTSWTFDGSMATATILFENANYRSRNSFGVFADGKRIELVSGDMEVGDSTNIDFGALGLSLGTNDFGFYLHSPDGVFYSDTAKNRDGIDHMLAAFGEEGEILLGFEDLLNGGDLDYDDLVIAIRQVASNGGTAPVPEPGTLLLLGSGLVGLASYRKNRRA